MNYNHLSFPVTAAATVLADMEWLNDSEEQMQAEDALWDASRKRHGDRFSALAAVARTAIDAGATQPMFTPDGDVR
jgi:hypothetical protein